MLDIMMHYGGSLLAMRGKASVAIVSDRRLGSGSITTSMAFERVHKISPRCYIGFTGFVPDAQALQNKIMKNRELFCLNERREMTPAELSSLVSYLLYSKRTSPYFCEPIIVGIHDNSPFICTMDQLGAMSTGGFAANGTAQRNLFGVSEAIFKEDLDDEDLFVAAMQTFLNSVDRDALSGWGADCYVISKEKVVKRSVKGRQD